MGAQWVSLLTLETYQTAGVLPNTWRIHNAFDLRLHCTLEHVLVRTRLTRRRETIRAEELGCARVVLLAVVHPQRLGGRELSGVYSFAVAKQLLVCMC